jgi:hypothetical protein
MSLFDTQKKKTILLLDIGNGSVAVGLASIASSRDGHPTESRVVRSVRETFSFEKKPTGSELQAALVDKLSQAFRELITQEKESAKNPHRSEMLKLSDAHQVLCTLSSPWFFSKGKTVSVAHDKTFVMTERFLEDVLEKEVDVFTEEIGSADDLSIVEKTIIGATVNGYHVLNPLHQRTDACDIYIYMTAANADVRDQIIGVLEKFSHLSREHIILHSFPLIAFSVIRDRFPHADNYLLFDVAGEITDIAWVSGGMITKTVSYPCGTHVPLRQIAKHFDVPYEVARSYLRLFLDGRAEKSIAVEIRTILIDSGKEFNIYLEEALKTLSPELLFPHHMFLSTYPHAREMFREFLRHGTDPDLNGWHQGVSITYLGEGAVERSEDVFLELEASFLSKFI